MTESKENMLLPTEDVSVEQDGAVPSTLLAEVNYRPVISDMSLNLPASEVPVIHPPPVSSTRSSSSLASPSSASSAQALADIIAEIHLLSKENRLLEAIIIRNAPADNENDTNDDNKDQDEQTKVIDNNAENTTLDDTSGTATLLTATDKCDLVIDELVYRRAQSASLSTKYQLDIQLLDSITTAITTRIGSLRKEAFSFQREVCMNGLNRDGYVRADIIAHWLDNTLKNKTNELHHYNAKINTLKQNIHKQENLISNKNNNSHDSLHSIDFHQLQIKNTQFTTKIKEKNQTLLTLKLSTGKAVHRLTEAKRILSSELNRTNILIKEMNDRTRQLSRLSDEKIRISNELIKSKNKTLTYQSVVSNPNMPTVMDYVLLKKNLHELMLRKKELIRKNEIIKGREKSQRQSISRQTRALTAPTMVTSSSIYNENTGMTATRPLDNRLPRI